MIIVTSIAHDRSLHGLENACPCANGPQLNPVDWAPHASKKNSSTPLQRAELVSGFLPLCLAGYPVLGRCSATSRQGKQANPCHRGMQGTGMLQPAANLLAQLRMSPGRRQEQVEPETPQGSISSISSGEIPCVFLPLPSASIASRFCSVHGPIATISTSISIRERSLGRTYQVLHHWKTQKDSYYVVGDDR